MALIDINIPLKIMSFTVLILDGEMVVHDWKEYISLQENPQNYHYRETGVFVSFCSQPQDHHHIVKYLQSRNVIIYEFRPLMITHSVHFFLSIFALDTNINKHLYITIVNIGSTLQSLVPHTILIFHICRKLEKKDRHHSMP